MKYELLSNGRGVLIDRTPIMQDIRDTFEVSFLLPNKGSYVALFRGEDGIEHKAIIKDKKVKMPSALLKKEQYVKLIVTEINAEEVIKAWECEPLKITAYFHLRENQWQVSGGMTDKNALERLTQIEKELVDINKAFENIKRSFILAKDKHDRQVQNLTEKNKEYMEALNKYKLENEKLASAYNNAIDVLNDHAKRLYALEKNYDPSIIK